MHPVLKIQVIKLKAVLGPASYFKPLVFYNLCRIVWHLCQQHGQVGLSALSPNPVMKLTRWREGNPCPGSWAGLRTGPVQTSRSSTKPSARSCKWVKKVTSRNTDWRSNRSRAPLRGRTWGCWWMKSLARGDKVQLQPRRSVVPWTVLKAVWAAGWGRGFFPSSALLCSSETSGVLCPGLGLPMQERWEPIRACPEEGHWFVHRAGTPLLWKQAERFGPGREDSGETSAPPST